MKTTILILQLFILSSMSAQDTLFLPEPVMTGGMPLMEALKKRCTTREFADKELSMQQISNLLWAATGVNRPETGKMTAPTARDSREIDVYIVLKTATYKYVPAQNILILQKMGDFRSDVGKQDFTKEAALGLLYVVDFSKMPNTPQEKLDLYGATDTGFISQNVYLFCASENLATVVLGSINREEIAATFQFSKNQKVILTQVVGFPTK
ncbi:MAG: nitroreductase family protein [Bacteroidetes bacterium]|nr:nitroreductase family protein [Bacteroidota bacterium]MBU1720829.1 nitroreductase family protein [Bacteroidota bacterium]